MAEVVCVGHLCLDVIPRMSGGNIDLSPGRLVEVGAAELSTGGSAANTGIALHKLGIDASVMGKVGDDPFGGIVLDLLRRQSPSLAAATVVAAGESTSYTVVISAPDRDRTFIHCPGANDTFGSGDIDVAALESAAVFHFGYPPLMARMYEHGGAELVETLRRAKSTGVTTSLDTSLPDAASASGKADWQAILAAALKWVDVFAPSLAEMDFMFGPATAADHASRCLDLGAKIALIKMGDRGASLATAERLDDLGRGFRGELDLWQGYRIAAPCFRVGVVGTTGAGDATVAGFILGILKGFDPGLAVTAAMAVGACACESADANGGIGPWTTIESRIAAGWPRR